MEKAKEWKHPKSPTREGWCNKLSIQWTDYYVVVQNGYAMTLRKVYNIVVLKKEKARGA